MRAGCPPLYCSLLNHVYKVHHLKFWRLDYPERFGRNRIQQPTLCRLLWSRGETNVSETRRVPGNSVAVYGLPSHGRPLFRIHRHCFRQEHARRHDLRQPVESAWRCYPKNFCIHQGGQFPPCPLFVWKVWTRTRSWRVCRTWCPKGQPIWNMLLTHVCYGHVVLDLQSTQRRRSMALRLLPALALSQAAIELRRRRLGYWSGADKWQLRSPHFRLGVEEKSPGDVICSCIKFLSSPTREPRWFKKKSWLINANS